MWSCCHHTDDNAADLLTSGITQHYGLVIYPGYHQNLTGQSGLYPPFSNSIEVECKDRAKNFLLTPSLGLVKSWASPGIAH